MKKTYQTPELRAQGSAVDATEVTGMPPQAETLFREKAAGSVGFAL